MAGPNLQDAITQAGSPMKLLWKPNSQPWQVPVIQPEYVGWRAEQASWRENVAIMDLSHHMCDLFIEGPDAGKLLAHVSANDFENFVDGQAKQFVPVNRDGNIITDGILMRQTENKYILSGVPAAQNWVRYHGIQGKYDVNFISDPDSSIRKNADPVLFRYQIQGPRALEVVEKMFGGPLPKTKFFHSTPVSYQGVNFRAFRHGMAGMPGYEFIGDYKDGQLIKDALLATGEEFGMIRVGGKAYFTNGIESGWIPTPTPAIYTDPELEDYRRFLPLFSFEGQRGLHGSFFSENIADYYCTPYELGYGRSIAFNHDFIGREALEKLKTSTTRARVTFVLNLEDVKKNFGENPDYWLSYARYSIQVNGRHVGVTYWTAFIDPVGTILSLGLINNEFAQPGTAVELVLGEHPGFGAASDVESGFPRLRATVDVSPYNEHARLQYRKNG